MSKAYAAAFACALCMSLGLAPLFMGTFPLFLQPVSQELGWGAAIYPQAALVAGMSGALLGPIIGQLIDRFGVRPMMFVGLLGWAASLVGMSFLDGSYLAMLIMAVFMGITSAICGPISFAKIVAGWFDRNRGLALGIVLSAAPAIATAIMVVVARSTIAEFGWRFSYRAFAAGVVLLGIPTAYFLMHEARVSDRAGTPGAADLITGATAREAVRTRDFWMVMLVTGLVCGVVQAMVAHFVAWSAERGISDVSATVALSAFSLVGPAGPLLAGALADRVRGPKLLVIFYALPLIGLALLTGVGASAVVPAMVLSGIGFQASTGMLPYLLTRYFGVRYASQLFGMGLGVVTLSMGIGPVLVGLARDQFHTFAPITPVLFVLLLVAIATTLMFRGYEANGSVQVQSKVPTNA